MFKNNTSGDNQGTLGNPSAKIVKFPEIPQLPTDNTVCAYPTVSLAKNFDMLLSKMICIPISPSIGGSGYIVET